MKIAYIDYYVPEQELPISDFLSALRPEALPAGVRDKSEYAFVIKNILKLASIRCESTLNDYRMVSMLLERLLQRRICRPDEISAVILAEGSPLDSTLLLKQLQREHKLEQSYSFSVSGNECINFEVALGLAASLLKADTRLDRILILSTTKLTTPEARVVGSYGIMGDAAGVMLVTRDSGLLEFADQVILSTGSLAGEDSAAVNGPFIHCRFIVETLSQLLERNSHRKNNIAHIIAQNASTLLFSQCLPRVGLSAEKLFTYNMGRYGHLDCLDFTVNVADLTKLKSLRADELILAVGMGWNGSYVASLLRPSIVSANDVASIPR